MKWINPGIAEIFDSVSGCKTMRSNESPTGFYAELGEDARGMHKYISASEIWFSYDFRLTSTWSSSNFGTIAFLKVIDSSDNIILYVAPLSKEDGIYLGIYNIKGTLLYTSEKSFIATVDNVWHNIEFHVKTGESGRIDIWLDTKLFCSFRSPSAFNGEMQKIGISSKDGGVYSIVRNYRMYASSFIIQDTRRIGLEKFKKLTIDPDTEQNMPQGSTTTYKLSGLSDATEFSDITSVCALLQPTSRDTNISTGTFSIEGADVGTIDVSDSSGTAYEIAHAETNSLTGKPWTRDDIEGKTLSFKVNGAS